VQNREGIKKSELMGNVHMGNKVVRSDGLGSTCEHNNCGGGEYQKI
jgi:hypothetical protein